MKSRRECHKPTLLRPDVGLAGGAGIGSVSADVEDFAATPSYERGTGRATMIDGTFVEVMPDGNVFDARTGEMGCR